MSDKQSFIQKDNSYFDKILEQLSLVDDIVFKTALEGNTHAAEEIIHPIIDKPLTVVKMTLQKSVSSVTSKSFILDMVAVDDQDTVYNVEIQKLSAGASPQRARLHGSYLDKDLLKKGELPPKTPERYVIFITAHDIFKKDLPLYHFEMYDRKAKILLKDGSHIIYADWSNPDENTDLGKLMHDLTCPDPDKMYNKELSKSLKLIKETDEGRMAMKDVMLELREDGRAEGRAEGEARGRAKKEEQIVLTMLKKGLSTDLIAEYTEQTIQYVKDLRQKFIKEGLLPA